MDERRTTRRRRELKSGTNIFNQGAGISCSVRNLSSAGACLEVVSPLGIPDNFILLIESDQTKRWCQVAWRHEKRIGVHFK